MPPAAAHVQFWILTGSQTNPTGHVLLHRASTLHYATNNAGATIAIKLAHLRFLVDHNELTTGDLLKSQFTYAGVTKTTRRAVIVCDLQKIPCHP
jgi:hypothetical protein